MAFEIRKEKVTINGVDYLIGPLYGDDLAAFFELANRLSKFQDDSDVIEGLGKEGISTLHYLVSKSLQQEYPTMKKEDIDKFAGQNLFKFLTALVTINTPKQD